jgi:hypothetical protein
MTRTAGLGRRHLALVPGESPPFVIKTQPVSSAWGWRAVLPHRSVWLCYMHMFLVWPWGCRATRVAAAVVRSVAARYHVIPWPGADSKRSLQCLMPSSACACPTCVLGHRELPALVRHCS